MAVSKVTATTTGVCGLDRVAMPTRSPADRLVRVVVGRRTEYGVRGTEHGSGAGVGAIIVRGGYSVKGWIVACRANQAGGATLVQD